MLTLPEVLPACGRSTGHTEQWGSQVTLAVLSWAQCFTLETSHASSEVPVQL